MIRRLLSWLRNLGTHPHAPASKRWEDGSPRPVLVENRVIGMQEWRQVREFALPRKDRR